MSAEWGSLRRMELDELRTSAQHAKTMLDTDGWKFLMNLLAARQQSELSKILAVPGNRPADQYALERSYTSGLVKGLQLAYEAPNALIRIAEEELERAQRAAEQEAHEQGDQQ